MGIFFFIVVRFFLMPAFVTFFAAEVFFLALVVHFPVPFPTGFLPTLVPVFVGLFDDNIEVPFLPRLVQVHLLLLLLLPLRHAGDVVVLRMGETLSKLWIHRVTAPS